MTRRYRWWRYLAGATVARTGDEMSGPALLLAALATTGSASAASLLLAGITVTAAVGGPLFGALLDRSIRPGRVLAAALALYASALIAVLAGLGRLPFAATVLIAVPAGLVGPALAGGWTSQLPRVVSSASLPRATALDAMTFSLAGLVGPALAGAVAGLATAATGVAVAAGLIYLALPSAWALPANRRLAQAAPATSVLADLTAGFRAICRRRALARATSASVISCAGEGMLVACSPLLGEEIFHSAGHGAFLLSGVAVAALVANALLAHRPGLLRPDAIIWCSTIVLAGALLVAATGQPALVIAATAIVGAAEGPQLTALFAVRHREAPDRLRSQIFTTGASLKITAFALGAAIAGPIATWSLACALVTAAGFHLLAAMAFAAVTVRGPSPPPRTQAATAPVPTTVNGADAARLRLSTTDRDALRT